MDIIKERSKDVLIEDNSINFESLFLSNRVLNGLKDYNFNKPSPIQLKAIPLGKCGFDLIIRAKSGTGKTAVFAIIALELLDTTNSELQVLILCPTREIAVQTCDVIKTIGKYITNLKVEQFIGGLPVKEDEQNAKGCHIAVASPGRMLHLMNSGTLKLHNIKLFVLDEADNLMHSSFQSDINQIYHSLPTNKQMLAVSATYPNELDIFLSKYMHIPTYVSPQMDAPLLLGLKHFVSITSFNANALFLAKIKNKELLRLLTNISFTQCLIFCNYQTRVEDVHTFLNANGWKSSFISGAQTQKQRLEALKELKEFSCRILLSTDLTARGIDAVNVDLVINYDIPNDESTYLHRMGRAGRYGTKGICLSIAAKGQEVDKFRDIIGSIGGCEIAVPVLPVSEIPENIWEANTDSFDCLKGSIIKKQDLKMLSAVREIFVRNKNKKVQRSLNINKSSSCDIVSKDGGTNIEAVTKKEIIPCKSTVVKTNHIDTSDEDDDDTMDILKKLANGCMNPNKETFTTKINDSKTSLYHKNISLLSVSSLLDDDRIDVDDNETDDNIQTYIATLKQPEEDILSTATQRDMMVTETMPNIDDIFAYAYDYAISKSNKNWEDVYNVTDKDNAIDVEEDAPVNLLQDLLDYAANDEEPEYDEYYGEDEYKHYVEQIENESSDQPSLQWIPVEEHHGHRKVVSMKRETEMPVSTQKEYTPHHDFGELYTSAMQGLHNTFNTLETVSDFETVWNQWQVQMGSIQDYVQQNLYLEEMNTYKRGLGD